MGSLMKYKKLISLLIVLPVISKAQIDVNATYETKSLYQNLIEFGSENLLFGHQDATAYGVGWNAVEGRCDVKEVCGDYPAVYGWDIGDIGNLVNVDKIKFSNIKRWIKEAYLRGGINTISMHLDNPYTRGDAWDNSPAVKYILPGGIRHSDYLIILDRIAEFLKELKTDAGIPIPIVFRPYHEHTQTWNWWGRSACTEEEFIALWKMTQKYLKDTHKIHNLLYAISPQDVNSYDGYFFRYPGDDYVDILGLDYYNLTTASNAVTLGSTLDMLGKEALKRGKVSAITETGVEKIPNSTWWTDCLYAAFNYSADSRRTAWALLWRNAHVNHFYAPYPGQASAPNFIKFYDYANTSFEKDIPDMYSLRSDDKTPPTITFLNQKTLTTYNTTLTVRLTTDERAYLKYSFTDQNYEEMPYQFESGQSGFAHSTNINLEHGQNYTLYFRAQDIYVNSSESSEIIEVKVDTTKMSVSWTSVDYTDSSWKIGTTPIGFNSTGLKTETKKEKTIYFRKKITLPTNLNGLGLLVKGHDGFIAYINGSEIGRINLPANEIIDFNTNATVAAPVSKVFIFEQDKMDLIREENVITVEMHVIGQENVDASFDARLFNNEGIYIDLGSTWKYYDEGQKPEDRIVDKLTDIKEIGLNYPNDFKLFQNYPNPFNPTTIIEYNIPYLPATRQNPEFRMQNSEFISLIIYDMLGREVEILVNEEQKPGKYMVEWNASNKSTGIYLYRMNCGNYNGLGKMILIK